jgi:hypothetical protein
MNFAGTQLAVFQGGPSRTGGNEDPYLDHTGRESPAAAHRRQLNGSIPPLKGGQSSAQGFNPGLCVVMRCALKGHQNPAGHK